jgi:two-component system, cell cycle sensor histidine kinase and response regulator CckA
MNSHGGASERTDDAVLVVDDDDALRSMLVMMLKMDGWTHVLDTPDCEEALRIAAQWSQKLRLAIVDMLMPQCSGSEFAQALRERHPNTKFLLISGDMDHLEEPLQRLGRCADGLPKPFNSRDLCQRVRALLDRTL